MVEAIDLSQKKPFTLVSFVHGGGRKDVTNWDSDYSLGGIDYESVPAMTIQLPENDGIFSQGQLSVQMPLDQDINDFTNRFTNSQPHAPTRVTVTEVIEPGAENPLASININTVFKGEAIEGKRNVGGQRGIVSFQALPLKSILRTISLGLPCNHQCIHNLGDLGCKVDLTISNRRLFPTIASIDGSVVTVNNNGAIPTGLDNRFFQRGFMTFEGLNVTIHDWFNEIAGDRLEFFMMRRPPDNWVGGVATLFSGCDKSDEVCLNRYNNRENFDGIGYAVPAYHPQYEDGGTLQSGST